MLKLLAQARQSRLPKTLAESGFLDTGRLNEVDEAFSQQREEEGRHFGYYHCVLCNCCDLSIIKQSTDSFLAAIGDVDLSHLTDADGDKLLESLHKVHLPMLKTVLDETNSHLQQSEKIFYAIHQMIEYLAGPIFQAMLDIPGLVKDNAPKSPHIIQAKLETCIEQLQKINKIMQVFNVCIKPEEFNQYRTKLSPASGAQSPLRFLDFFFVPNFQVDQGVKHDDFTQGIQAQEKDNYDKIMAIEAKTPFCETEDYAEKSNTVAFAKDLKEQYPDYHLDDNFNLVDLARKNLTLLPFIKPLLWQRSHFKLIHYQIVHTQIGHETKGTGGTHFEHFLRFSFLRDYMAWRDLEALSRPKEA